MKSVQIKEPRTPWVVLALCVVMAVIAIGLTTTFADPAWKFSLMVVIAGCFVFAAVAIGFLRAQICELRRQVALLEEKAGIGSGPPADAKGAYDVDEEGRRRLHISRLEVFFLIVVPSALTLL